MASSITLVCMKCGIDKNLYSSPKYCAKRTFCWKEEVHVFCLFCCLKFSRTFNDDTKDMGFYAKIVCPIKLCYSALFEIEHCETKVTRGIEDLMKELDCFNIAYKREAHENVMLTIDNMLHMHLKQLALENFIGHHKECFDMYLDAKRRFTAKPNTYAEYQKPAAYEMEWYKWEFAKCAKCGGEFNLYQCIDKSDCKHVCCLKCFLYSSIYEPRNYMICPVCYSYSAGSLERYACKTQLPRGVFEIIWMDMYRTTTLEGALDNTTRRRPSPEQQAAERLLKTPECYNMFKNLDKCELPLSEYKLIWN